MTIPTLGLGEEVPPRAAGGIVKDAKTLLNLYVGVYLIACTAMLSVTALALALGRQAPGEPGAESPAGALAAAILLALLAAAIGWRLREFARFQHIPGPRPSFFLGNLKSLLLHEHGARDKALLELHRTYGPVVKLHLAWGSRPFVSVAEVPKSIRQASIDSNRRADSTVLPNSLMGLKAGEKHQAHRQQLNPHFLSSAVKFGLDRSLALSAAYLQSWEVGQMLHGNLKSDLHHWSADSLGLFLCGEDWKAGHDLTPYLEAIAVLEEAISFRAFHPFFVRAMFPVKSARARRAYRYLFVYLEAALLRRQALRPDRKASQDTLGKLATMQEVSQAWALPWTHDDCVEELISLVAGGTDAMSYTVAQALVLLSRNPEVQQAAYEAAGLAKQEKQGGLNPFMLNIVRETMRLFPAVPFSSKFSDERELDVLGMTLPTRTNVMWMKTAVGQNSTIFNEAHRFAPGRFTSGNASGRAAESISGAMPFGAGMRHCIGHHLAEELCTRFLTDIVHQFTLQDLPEVDVKYLATVSVTPSTVPVMLHARS
jgi:cytochrome P450